MAVRWQIRFKTLSEHDGLVKVYDSTYSGDAIDLTPAVSAISTTIKQEELFEPVVSDSGYLRVIDNGLPAEHIEDMHPLGAFDRPVEFYLDNILKWRGYISPESFTEDWEPAPREVAFPLVGALSVLDSVNIANNGTDLQTIAAFIKEILEATGFNWDRVLIAKQMVSVDEYNIFPEMRLFLSRYDFVSFNTAQNVEDPDWTRYVGVSYLTCLRAICTYFGWTACQEGADLVLTNSRLDLLESGFNALSWAHLSALAADYTTTVTETPVPRPVLTLQGLIFDGINHRISTRNGRKKVTVESTVSASGNLMPQLRYNGKTLETQGVDLIGPEPSTPIDIHGRVRFLDPSKESVYLYSYEWYADRETFARKNWAVPGTPFVMQPRADVVEAATWEDNELHRITRPDYKKYLRLCRMEITDGKKILDGDKPLAELSGGEPGYFSAGGALCLSAYVRNNYVRDPNPSTPPTMPSTDDNGLTQWGPFGASLRMSISLGDKYWDGSSWGDTETIISVPVDSTREGYGNPDDPYEGVIKDNNDGRFKNAVGYVIPVPDSMYGRIKITLYPWSSPMYLGDEINTLYLRDIRMDYYNDALTDDPGNSGVKLALLTGRSYKDDADVSLSMASLSDEQTALASNQYLMWQNKPLQDIQMTYVDGSVLTQPEYWLVDSLCKAFTKPATWLELEVRRDNSITPYSVITSDGKRFIVAGIVTDYSDEHIKMYIVSYE